MSWINKALDKGRRALASQQAIEEIKADWLADKTIPSNLLLAFRSPVTKLIDAFLYAGFGITDIVILGHRYDLPYRHIYVKGLNPNNRRTKVLFFEARISLLLNPKKGQPCLGYQTLVSYNPYPEHKLASGQKPTLTERTFIDNKAGEAFDEMLDYLKSAISEGRIINIYPPYQPSFFDLLR